jgi:hypothetical protein
VIQDDDDDDDNDDDDAVQYSGNFYLKNIYITIYIARPINPFTTRAAKSGQPEMLHVS